jgi:hypothetical protein
VVAPHEPARQVGRARINPRRETERRSSRRRDRAFLAFIHSPSCPLWCEASLPGHRCARGALGGVVEGDHQGRRGTGQKSDDDETVKLCKLIHVARDSFVGAEFREGGVFAGWGREEMRDWVRRGIAHTRAAYERSRWHGLDGKTF